jgi:hypothetical protein
MVVFLPCDIFEATMVEPGMVDPDFTNDGPILPFRSFSKEATNSA